MNPRVYPLLMASSVLVALVDDRITPVTAPQDTLRPYIVYTPVGLSSEQYLNCPEDTDYDRVQIDCYADTHEAASDVANAARSALQKTGYIASSFDDYESDTLLYRVLIDWSFVTLS